eukprot:Gb_37206 [translate_table: standard]
MGIFFFFIFIFILLDTATIQHIPLPPCNQMPINFQTLLTNSAILLVLLIFFFTTKPYLVHINPGQSSPIINILLLILLIIIIIIILFFFIRFLQPFISHGINFVQVLQRPNQPKNAGSVIRQKGHWAFM